MICNMIYGDDWWWNKWFRWWFLLINHILYDRLDSMIKKIMMINDNWKSDLMMQLIYSCIYTKASKHSNIHDHPVSTMFQKVYFLIIQWSNNNDDSFLFNV